MKTLRMMKIFLLGMFEFRLATTAHFDEPEIDVYDLGRELAHRLTFRKFEEGERDATRRNDPTNRSR